MLLDTVILNCDNNKNNLQQYSLNHIFDQINAALICIRDFFPKNLTDGNSKKFQNLER